MIVDIYELVSEIESSRLDHHFDNLPYSFNQSNRTKLKDASDLEVFDLVRKVYEITIIYRSDRIDGDTKLEYRKYDNGEIISFTDTELKIFGSLDWRRLSHNLKAHVYDVIWLCNKNHEAAKIAAEEYYILYLEWFDKEHWVQCVDYINRAIELAAKIGSNDKKNIFLARVYTDVIRLNEDDSSFLSISLMELLISQSYCCDFNTLIPLTDRLISKNEGSISTSHIVEQAYHVKANLYKKLKDTISENKVYVLYADTLMQGAEKLVKEPDGKNTVDNRNWFMAENNIKKAIGLFQNHGASEKAVNAQKRLIEIQKDKLTHMPMHEFKYDISDFYKQFIAEYEDHNIHELIWDMIFAFEFQSKEKIRDDVTKNSSQISSLFPIQLLGSEGQTEFLLPGLKLDDEDNILLHMYYKAREYERIQGDTVGRWFIQYFRKLNLQEADLDMIFENNPIIPKGQEKDVQRGVYYGLIGHMSDSLDKLAPKVENIIRNLAEMCGDLMTYYDSQEGVQKKKVLSQVFIGEKLNESVEEDILFTFDGLLQQKAGSNIRNRIGHGLNKEAECSAGDCIYFVIIVLKFCAFYCESFIDEIKKIKHNQKRKATTDYIRQPKP